MNTRRLALALSWALGSAACGPGVGAEGESSGGSGTATGSSATPTHGGSDNGVADSTITNITDADTTNTEPTPVELHIEAYCQAWLSVPCPQPRYDSVEECIEHYGAHLDPWVARAEAGTATFDPECAAAKVEQVLGEEPECPGGVCRIFHGSTGQDQPCERDFTAPGTDCDEGLFCAPCTGALFCETTCQPWCQVAGTGEACNAASCEPEHWCVGPHDTTNTPTCEPIPNPGDPCLLPPEGCGLDMWCDDGLCSDQYLGIGSDCTDAPCDVEVAFCDRTTHSCVAQRPLGSACTVWYQCQSGACVLDQCVPLPDTVGAACHQHKRCAGDLECDSLTRTCREPYPSLACNVALWCPSSRRTDDVCDEGEGPDACPPNIDASDCGYCPPTRQGDGQCDETTYCAEGTDPDCPDE